MKFEQSDFKYNTGSFQVWAMFDDNTAFPVSTPYGLAVEAARVADEYARGTISCEYYDRARIVSFLVCKVSVREIARLRKKIVPESKIVSPSEKETKETSSV